MLIRVHRDGPTRQLAIDGLPAERDKLGSALAVSCTHMKGLVPRRRRNDCLAADLKDVHALDGAGVPVDFGRLPRGKIKHAHRAVAPARHDLLPVLRISKRSVSHSRASMTGRGLAVRRVDTRALFQPPEGCISRRAPRPLWTTFAAAAPGRYSLDRGARAHPTSRRPKHRARLRAAAIRGQTRGTRCCP